MNQNPKSAIAAGLKEKNGSEKWAISANHLRKRPVYIFGKPVARDILFSNHKGVYKKWVEKRQRWLLIKIPFINSFLEDGEMITLITSGYAPLTRIERFLLRYLTVFQRRALFVFTDRRLFFIPTTFTYGYRFSVAEIRYANCRSIKVSGRSLAFTFLNGGYEEFPYIGRKECRKLRYFVGNLALGVNPTGSHMTYLCGRCGTAIPDNRASCPKCRLQFQTAASAGKMALLIPGGGYFYLHNTLYGIAGAILELLLSVLLILSVVDMYQNFNGSALAVILLSTALAGIKAVSFSHSRGLAQGCFPVKRWQPSIKS